MDIVNRGFFFTFIIINIKQQLLNTKRNFTETIHDDVGKIPTAVLPLKMN